MSTLGVLITYYNEGPGLTACLQSLLRQPGCPDEIIIYDDASALPADSFVPPDFKGEIIRGSANVGPGVGRNILLKKTGSQYIHFHDADDLFTAGWCTRIREEISKNHPDAIFTEISSYESGTLVTERIQGLSPMNSSDELVKFCLRGAILTSAGTYQTDTVRGVGGYRESLWQSEDFDFHIRMAAKGISFRILTDPLVHRTQVAGRSGKQLEVWSSALQAIFHLSAELPTKYRQDLSEAAARISSILFKLGSRDEARKGFTLALQLGPPSYEAQQKMYRWVASHMGPETAEWVSLCYRRLFPGRLRSLLR